MEVKSIIMKSIAVIIFAALFPTALSTMFAVDTTKWVYYPDGNLSNPVPNNIAISLWNLTGWIILIFGGVMVFMSESD